MESITNGTHYGRQRTTTYLFDVTYGMSHGRNRYGSVEIPLSDDEVSAIRECMQQYNEFDKLEESHPELHQRIYDIIRDGELPERVLVGLMEDVTW